MTQAAAPRRAGSSYPGTGVHPDLLPVGTEVCGFRLLRHVATGSFGSVWQVESLLDLLQGPWVTGCAEGWMSARGCDAAQRDPRKLGDG